MAMIWIYPPPTRFWVGNPNLDLHLPLESWVECRSKLKFNGNSSTWRWPDRAGPGCAASCLPEICQAGTKYRGEFEDRLETQCFFSGPLKAMPKSDEKDGKDRGKPNWRLKFYGFILYERCGFGNMFGLARNMLLLLWQLDMCGFDAPSSVTFLTFVNVFAESEWSLEDVGSL